MSLPKFDVPSSQAEWDMRMKGFHTKMTRCTRMDGIQNIPSNLNILRLSTDFDGPQQAESWAGIQTFLGVSGYDIEDMQMTEPREADLLFISTDPDRLMDVEYLVSMIAQGFLGLMPKDEVLVSGPGKPGHSPYDQPPNMPLLLSTDFMVYGMCLIHGYITALYDPRTRLGKHISMMLLLEGKLQNSGIAGTDADRAFDKTEAFKSLLKQRGHVDGEARWVFAVFDMLRHLRNYFGHTPPLPKSISGAEGAKCVINDLAIEYGRPHLALRDSGIQDPNGVRKRWVTQLTQITASWIDEYLKNNPPRPTTST